MLLEVDAAAGERSSEVLTMRVPDGAWTAAQDPATTAALICWNAIKAERLRL